MSSATSAAECAACGSMLTAGAPFCSACGAPSNGSARPAVAAAGALVTEPVLAVASATGSPGGVPAIVPRVLAYLLDQAAVGVVVGIALVVVLVVGGGSDTAAKLAGLMLVPVLAAATVVIGQWLWEARTGKTIGNVVLNLRTVSAVTGRPAGAARILLRLVLLGLGAAVAYVGGYVVAASGAWDRSGARRGWHDKLAGTVVVAAAATTPSAEIVDAAPLGALAARGTPAGSAGSTAAAASPAASTAELISAVPGFARPTGAAAVPALVPAESPLAAATPLPVSASVAAPFVLSVEAPVARPVALAVALPEQAAPAPVEAAAEALAELEETRLAGGRSGSEPVTGRRRFTLTFDSGATLEVTGDGVVGRNPAPAPGETAAHVVPLPDDSRTVSKTHLAFGLDPAGLWVADRGSTNGSALRDADGVRTVLAANERAHVTAGTIVEIGDRSFRVDAT